MKHFISPVKILSAVLVVQVAQATNYCDPALCTDYQGNVKPHIGCNNEGVSS